MKLHSIPTKLQSCGPSKSLLASIIVGTCAAAHAAPIPITGAGSYSQDFDEVLPTSETPWSDDSTLEAWYASHTGATNVRVGTGSSDDSGLYSFGADGSSERALGSLSSGGTGTIRYGVLFQNTSGSSIKINSLIHTGEQWRKASSDNVNTLSFSYQRSESPITDPGAGNWTAVAAGDFSGPISNNGSATALDGNDSANQAAINTDPGIIVFEGEYVMLRWADPDDDSTDHGLAIDDLSVSWAIDSSQALSAGSIAFVGFNSDGGDHLAFVAIDPIRAGEAIYFTDTEWDEGTVGADGQFVSGEGYFKWNAPTGGIAAGTIVLLNDLNLSGTIDTNLGTITDRTGTFDLAGSNETAFAYLGTESSPTAFLAAVSNGSDSIIGTGLGASSLVTLPSNVDIAAYTGSRTDSPNFAGYLTSISNTGSNWITQNGNDDQSNDTTAPDVPFDTTPFTLGGGGDYSSWAATHSVAEGIGGDDDHDGISNLAEYGLGLDPQAGNGSTGDFTSGLLSFTKGTEAYDNGDVTWTIETASDLAGPWTPVTPSDDSATIISYTLPTGMGRIFARLKMTTP